jgi:hypothetical protein
VRDLFRRGAPAAAALPVYEDELEGYTVSGLSYRQVHEVKRKGEGRPNIPVPARMREQRTGD